MLTKEEAQEILDQLHPTIKSLLYDNGCYLTFRSGKATPWEVSTWGDCFMDEVGRFATLEEAIAVIETLPTYTWKSIMDWRKRVW